MSAPQKVAVLRPGALGDGIATFPVLASLRAAWPAAEILAIGSPVFRLAVRAGLATGWLAFDDPRLTGLFAEGGTAEVLADRALCIVYAGRGASDLAARLEASGVSRVIPWPARPDADTHIVDHLLGALDDAEIDIAARQPVLEPLDAWVEEGRALLAQGGIRDSFAALHPGSGGRAKRWPVERFLDLARRMDTPIAWLLGPAEHEDEELRRIGGQAGAVLEPATLTALAGILTNCEVYVGNDSGVTHLAAALGVPTVAVFGPTDPAVWGPRGERVALLGGPGWGGFDAVEVDDVLAAAAELKAQYRTPDIK